MARLRDKDLLIGAEIRPPAPIQAGVGSRGGAELRHGAALPAGLDGPIGMVARGCADHTTAPSLLA